MATSIFPHVFPVNWEGVVFDRAAIGATARTSPDAAVWVAMRPSVFLEIATPLPSPRPSLGWIRERLDESAGIAPAELRVDARLSVPLALSHEGRHRMTALKDRLGDRAVPVRMSFSSFEDHEVDAVFVQRIRQGLRSQRGRSHVTGPIFEEAELDVGGVWASGIPPPLRHFSCGPCASVASPTTLSKGQVNRDTGEVFDGTLDQLDAG